MAKALMIQGTMSNAGKSLLTGGLLRVFKQDGYKAAPFKSQNMALNSYITEEGLEMGRAQVMQAEAAGISPSVRMNPILLKPTNDTGSQVIVNGEVRGNMSARDYFRYKRELIPDIMEAYRSLEEEYDVIVLEGAGSPAEINLKQDDIVNMGMAKLAEAPVLLAGDIDRGGVFAQLYGTVMLLTEEERRMVKGTIINKFRGDKSILDPGIRMMEEKIGIPTVGVIPYLHVDIDDEDSQRLIRLFNDPAGREYLIKEAHVDEEVVNKLGYLGISGTANVLCAIKMAKYYEMTEHDVVATVLTDSIDMYGSRIKELEEQYGPYTMTSAAVDHNLHMLGLRTDNMEELTYVGRKRIHNLKYYTWVEQQGKTVEELNDLWYAPEKTWKGVHSQAKELDELINAFNDASGVLKSL